MKSEETIKLAREFRAQGLSYRKIMKRLEEKGHTMSLGALSKFLKKEEE